MKKIYFTSFCCLFSDCTFIRVWKNKISSCKMVLGITCFFFSCCVFFSLFFFFFPPEHSGESIYFCLFHSPVLCWAGWQPVNVWLSEMKESMRNGCFHKQMLRTMYSNTSNPAVCWACLCAHMQRQNSGLNSLQVIFQCCHLIILLMKVQ